MVGLSQAVICLLQRALVSEQHGCVSNNKEKLVVRLGEQAIEKENFCGAHFGILVLSRTALRIRVVKA